MSREIGDYVHVLVNLKYFCDEMPWLDKKYAGHYRYQVLVKLQIDEVGELGYGVKFKDFGSVMPGGRCEPFDSNWNYLPEELIYSSDFCKAMDEIHDLRYSSMVLFDKYGNPLNVSAVRYRNDIFRRYKDRENVDLKPFGKKYNIGERVWILRWTDVEKAKYEVGTAIISDISKYKGTDDIYYHCEFELEYEGSKQRYSRILTKEHIYDNKEDVFFPEYLAEISKI